MLRGLLKKRLEGALGAVVSNGLVKFVLTALVDELAGGVGAVVFVVSVLGIFIAIGAEGNWQKPGWFLSTPHSCQAGGGGLFHGGES